MPHLSRLSFIISAIVFSSCISASSSEIARGTVFHDKNENGAFDRGEKRLRGVGISNGVDIVETDSRGQYEISVEENSFVFVIKPSGWRTAQRATKIPEFYYTHKPDGSPELNDAFAKVAPTGKLPSSIDFPLYKQDEPNTFKLILFGDTQPRTQQEVDFIAHDVVEELIGFEASFGMTLGDVVFDDLSLLVPLERLVSTIGVPWYNVHGNHDINTSATNNEDSDETWESLYGPTYYSFDYAQVHFVVLDDIMWEGDKKYHGELGERQLAFLKNDIARVPKDKLIVLSMHIPLPAVVDRASAFEILHDHPNHFSVSAHYHRQENLFMGQADGWQREDAYHHLIHATVCGSWWTGITDELGIPHATMGDGAPNGYSIVTFDGNDYSVRFKAARRPADHQMNIYAPEVVQSSADAEIVVNVFAGSERSIVKMRLSDSSDWIRLDQTPRTDPQFEALLELGKLMPAEAGRQYFTGASETTHIWSGNLPTDLKPGVHLLEVFTEDMYGQTYTDHRTIRVE